MTPRPILTAAAMRAAEAACFAAGTDATTLMERAGAAVAEAVWRYSGGAATLVLCGPGNNGGDGYVIARVLRERGVAVTVAADDPPRTMQARAARDRWDGPVQQLAAAQPAPVLVDALFGIGLARALDGVLLAALTRLAAGARWRIAVDVPSGVASDDGGVFGQRLPLFDRTVALGALKPAHRLQPAAALCGQIVVADIGLGAVESDLTEITRPTLRAPGAADHKYTRGFVAVVAGEMAGAALLAATAAQRSGAGYVMLAGSAGGGGLHALVHRAGVDMLGDARIGAVLCGPGLGRSDAARDRLEAALTCGRPLVLDADALALVTIERLRALPQVPILTPHAGEFDRLFGEIDGGRIVRARTAAARAGAVVILKGADTVVAAPDGRVAMAPPAPAWLATAGTGDVLAGIVATMRAQEDDPFTAAQAAVWLHGAAAESAGPVLVADDLADHLKKAIAQCL